jgi:hypothetical protein
VICLDDFEELLDRTDRFNDDFYDNLRSLMGDRALMMVIASRQRLIKYSRQKRLTSDFFNVFQAGRLKEFSDTEAQDLVRLPHPEQPALGEEKQTLALQWGGHHPCLLQIAGRCLWEARQRDRSNDWAKAQFHERSLGVPQPLHLIKHGVREVTRLGQLGQWIGDTQDSLGNFLKGAFIIVLIVLAITGVATWPQIQQWFKDTTTETLENFE